MHSIITYASNHSFDYKTNKSIYNILNGKKSHQTFLMHVPTTFIIIS